MRTPLAEQISARLADREQDCLAFDGRWRNCGWLSDMATAINAAFGDARSAGLIARNRPQHIAAFAAGIMAGRTTCMMMPGQPSAIAADILRLRLPAIIADAQDWTEETLAAARASGSAAIALSDSEGGDGVRILLPRQADDRSEAAPSIAFELLTSGTTGAPKRFPLTWDALAKTIAGAKAAYAGTSAANRPQIMVHPLGNISGIAYVAPPLVFGQPIVLLEKFDARAWADAVRQYKPVRGTLPPAGVRMLLDAGIEKADLASLDLVAVGGGALDIALHEAFEERYGIPLLTAFGATEFGGVIANWSLDTYRTWGPSKRGSAGQASAGISLRVVDPDSSEILPAGATGLLEAHVPRIGPDWIRTTDLAAIDEDGFLFHRGRADGAINRGGFKIVPDMLAAAIREHPDVADAAVVGLPDDRLGEVPVAAVELVAGGALDPDALRIWLKQRLLPYQVPVTVKIVACLPRNASMKISQSSIKALFG